MHAVIFFFNDTATTEIYTLSLHDALPIWASAPPRLYPAMRALSMPSSSISATTSSAQSSRRNRGDLDRKSTRLNSSHANISYAVFCLKKKKTNHDKRQAYGPETRNIRTVS